MIQTTRYTFLRCRQAQDDKRPAELLLSCVRDVLHDTEANGTLLLPWFVDKTALYGVNLLLRELSKSPNSVDIGTLRDSIANGTIYCNPRNDQELACCITKFVDLFGEGRSKKLHIWEESQTHPYSLSLTFQNESQRCVLGEFIRAGTREAVSTRWVERILSKWNDERIVDAYNGPMST